jgi:hypothetical protein
MPLWGRRLPRVQCFFRPESQAKSACRVKRTRLYLFSLVGARGSVRTGTAHRFAYSNVHSRERRSGSNFLAPVWPSKGSLTGEAPPPVTIRCTCGCHFKSAPNVCMPNPRPMRIPFTSRAHCCTVSKATGRIHRCKRSDQEPGRRAGACPGGLHRIVPGFLQACRTASSGVNGILLSNGLE